MQNWPPNDGPMPEKASFAKEKCLDKWKLNKNGWAPLVNQQYSPTA